MGFFAELEEGSKTGYIMGGVDERETKVECLDELEIGMAQLKHVYLRLLLQCEITVLEERGGIHTWSKSEKSISM